MIVELALPSGHLGMYPKVSIETELTGAHHEQFLSSPETMFTRTVASVLNDLLKVGDANRIAHIDLAYLFLTVRAMSISPVYKSEWACKKEVTPAGGSRQECGHKNSFQVQISKIAVPKVPRGFEYPRYNVKVSVNDVSFETKIYVRFLTVAEEFEVIDDLSDEGIAQSQLAASTANLYKYARRRVLKGLMFEDQRANDMFPDQKEAFLNGLPIKLTQSLFDDLRHLDSDFGPQLSNFAVTCSKCKGESRLAMPFSAALLLP